MKTRMFVGLTSVLGCFGFATPASAQPWRIGPQISAMARDGKQVRDVTHWIRERQLQRVRQNPHRPLFGNAWGLRGGKPYTGNGSPLNGLANGSPFQDSANAPNGFGLPPRNRDRTFRSFRDGFDETRGFSRGGLRSGRQRGRGFGGGRGRR